MTREQQLEVRRIIEREGATIDEEGFISKDVSIYTPVIDALRKQTAYVFYQGSVHQLWISDWDENLMKEPEKEPESATRMEVRAFYGGGHIELKKIEDDAGHDHVHIIADGEDLGYMHIDSHTVQWCGVSSQFIHLQKDC